MKATTKQLFDYATGITNNSFYANSTSQEIADEKLNAIVKALPETSLAYKIVTGNRTNLSDKQIWVIVFELQKNDTFSNTIANYYAEINTMVARQKSNKEINKAIKAKRLAELQAKVASYKS